MKKKHKQHSLGTCTGYLSESAISAVSVLCTSSQAKEKCTPRVALAGQKRVALLGPGTPSLRWVTSKTDYQQMPLEIVSSWFLCRHWNLKAVPQIGHWPN